MAIPSSGEIKISEIATEFGDTAPNQMSEYYRGGGLVPNTPANAAVPTSGQIAVANFYGAQNRSSVPLTISANTQNYNVYTQASASPSYVAGATDITLTIQPGVLVGSSSTGTYALNIPSDFTAGDTVTVVNNGCAGQYGVSAIVHVNGALVDDKSAVAFLVQVILARKKVILFHDQ